MLERDEVIDAEEMKKNLTVQKTEAVADREKIDLVAMTSHGWGGKPADALRQRRFGHDQQDGQTASSDPGAGGI